MMMNYSIYILLIIFFCLVETSNSASLPILPFYRIKIVDEDIYFTLSSKSSEWHKLLSIDSVGSDAIIKFAKNNYGESKCDYQIECYKYNIIVNFDKIYTLMHNSKSMPERLELESEFDNKVQNGIDVESTNEKYKMNQKNIEENIKLSINTGILPEKIFASITGDSFIFKGINKIKKSFSQIFQNVEDEGKIKTEGDQQNLRKEILDIKNGIENIEKEEMNLEKNLKNDLQNINSSINKEKTILENIWKSEIIAGMIGAILVFSLFAIYYVCNGLLKSSKNARRAIN